MKYERLARSRRGLWKWHELWLGEDHLLAMESTGYSEEYIRYYFKDIQAIISRRTAWGNVLDAIFGTLAAISLVVSVSGYENGQPPVSVTAGIFGGFFLILLLWNLVGGPTCCCHVRTQLGTDELPALYRARRVRKVLLRLRPVIEQLQGGITRQEIIELTGMPEDVPSVVSPAVPAAKVAGTEPEVAENTASHYGGGFHLAAFGLLVADSAVSTYQIINSPDYLGHVSMVLNIIFLIFAVIALIKQTKHPQPSLANWMIWGGIATIVVAGFFVGFIFEVYFYFKNIQSGIKPKGNSFDMATLAAANPVFAFYLLAYALLEAAMGIGGLFTMMRKVNFAGRDRL